MPTQNKDKAEKGGTAAKLKKRKTNIQRSHTFGSSYENPATKKKDSPTLKEKKNTPSSSPFPEPKYTKAVYLLLEAKKLAREIEEKKKNGDLFRNKLRGSELIICAYFVVVGLSELFKKLMYSQNTLVNLEDKVSKL